MLFRSVLGIDPENKPVMNLDKVNNTCRSIIQRKLSFQIRESTAGVEDGQYYESKMFSAVFEECVSEFNNLGESSIIGKRQKRGGQKGQIQPNLTVFDQK